MTSIKVPPHSTEAEMAVLGAMLIDKDSIQTVSEIISPAHFYEDVNRKIYQAILELDKKGRPVDIVTLVEELKKQERLEDMGGQKYLADLIEKVSTPAHTQSYAQIIKQKAILRDLIKASTKVIESSYANDEEVDAILDNAQKQIIEIAQSHTDHGFSSSENLAHDVLEKIENYYKEHKTVTGVPTGFNKLDELTGGLQKSNLIILAARPSQGKTAMALNVAQHAASKDIPVAIFSLEMDKHAVYLRMVCSEAKANLWAVRTGKLERTIWTKLTSSIAKLAKAPIWIDDTPGLTILEIRTRARKIMSQLKRENKQLGLLIIDYLQLIRGHGRQESRQQEVSEISRLLKDLARSLDIPILALSQLNRRTEDRGREGNRPQLSDLRESGSLEQDADAVALIFREWFYKKEDESLKNKAELILAKQRNGPVGTIELRFLEECTSFENPTPQGIERLEEIPI
ncbi:MAG: replicative DNA helicase [Elusimicrobia bacterium]|nr:replicative DNA helicase [Elusimicrobiota bacterium]